MRFAREQPLTSRTIRRAATVQIASRNDVVTRINVFTVSPVNQHYAQWRRAEDFQAMLHDPRASEHMKLIREIATNDAHLYEVTESFTAGD